MISYGTMIGGDSDFRPLKRDWTNVGTVYLGYQGSQYNYGGSSIYASDVSATSNGGVLGITETFYKGNFYTALTATAGGNFSEIHGMYGKEDIPLIMGGIASKSGYNIELKNGKFIIQPNLLMSYNFVTTFNSTNPVGVKIDNKPMHTIQLNPSVKFIGNTKNGWQPYATVGMVWNMINNTDSTADNIELPRMSNKPYIEYGLGIQKLWNDRFSAYGQATVHNGGRNGIAITAGMRWALGKDNSKPQKDLTPTQNVKPVNYIEKSVPVPPDSKTFETTPTENLNTINEVHRFAPVPGISPQTVSIQSSVQADETPAENLNTLNTVHQLAPVPVITNQTISIKSTAQTDETKSVENLNPPVSTETLQNAATLEQILLQPTQQQKQSHNNTAYIKSGDRTIIKQLNPVKAQGSSHHMTTRSNNLSYLRQML